MKKIAILIMVFTLIISSFALVGCDNKNDWVSGYTAGEFGIKNSNNPLVQITFSTGDTVRLELYPDQAPITVANFIRLAKAGTFNGLTMHRIIENFMIQGGGYTRNEDGILKTPDLPNVNNIKGEFASNGVQNNVSHLKGVISMARTNVPDSASSQFFICSVDSTFLDGQYAGFGRVIDEESMQAVVKISEVETNIGYVEYYSPYTAMEDVPVNPINIVKVEVKD